MPRPAFLLLFLPGVLACGGGAARSAATGPVVSPADLDSLRRATSDPAFCMLRSGRAGIPDEGQPSLTVRSGPRPCTVTLWDGEWEEVAAARPARDAVRAIIDRLKRE